MHLRRFSAGIAAVLCLHTPATAVMYTIKNPAEKINNPADKIFNPATQVNNPAANIYNPATRMNNPDPFTTSDVGRQYRPFGTFFILTPPFVIFTRFWCPLLPTYITGFFVDKH